MYHRKHEQPELALGIATKQMKESPQRVEVFESVESPVSDEQFHILKTPELLRDTSQQLRPR